MAAMISSSFSTPRLAGGGRWAYTTRGSTPPERHDPACWYHLAVKYTSTQMLSWILCDSQFK